LFGGNWEPAYNVFRGEILTEKPGERTCRKRRIRRGGGNGKSLTSRDEKNISGRGTGEKVKTGKPMGQLTP